MRKRLTKCIASFDYFDKLVIFISITTVSISFGYLQLSFEHQKEWQVEVWFHHLSQKVSSVEYIRLKKKFAQKETDF